MVTRTFEPYTNGASVVRAHKVTEETAGNVVLVDGTGQRVNPGDVLLETSNSNRFDVVPGKTFDADYSPGEDTWVEDESTVEFDPSDHKATEVRNYLHRSDVSDEEKDRVRAAEEAGLNRPSALR